MDSSLTIDHVYFELNDFSKQEKSLSCATFQK